MRKETDELAKINILEQIRKLRIGEWKYDWRNQNYRRKKENTNWKR
jgi:hypothetical protein